MKRYQVLVDISCWVEIDTEEDDETTIGDNAVSIAEEALCSNKGNHIEIEDSCVAQFEEEGEIK